MNQREVQSVVVTGGAKGLGAAIVRRFAAAGADVLIADLDLSAAEALADEIGGAAISCDVTREDDIAAIVDHAVARFGGLDVMVNNAGVIGAVGSLIETSAEDWHRTLAVHLDGVVFGLKHAGRIMKPQGYGAIVSMSSASALGGGFGPHAYVAAKAAVIALTRSVASEYLNYGIRVTAVAPGIVETPMTQGMQSSLATAPAPSQATALPVTPADVADAVFFLSSASGAAVNGQTLAIDGGLLATGGRLSRFHSAPTSFVGSL